MKVTYLLILMMTSIHAWAGSSYFMGICTQAISKKMDNYDLNKLQFSWLSKRFNTTDCSSLKTKISSLNSFNQIIPAFQYDPWGKRNTRVPFMPFQLVTSSFQYLATEEEWNLYRAAFSTLSIFSEFKNLIHINHDPSGRDTQSNLCSILEEVPSIESVTIRYSKPNLWPLEKNEIDCLQRKNIKIYIMGDFFPDNTSEEFVSLIRGIESYRGELQDLPKYQELQFLGLTTYRKGSQLKVLMNNKNLRQLHISLNDVADALDIGHLIYLNYLSINCINSKSPTKEKCTGTKLNDLNFIGSLKSLKGLDLSWNDIKNISPLSKLDKLEILNLKANRIKEATPLQGLKRLKYLDISQNEIPGIEAIKYLKNLRFLNISGNPISDISITSYLPNLTYFSAGRTHYSFKNFRPTKNLKVLCLSGYASSDQSEMFHLKHAISPSFEKESERGWTHLILFDEFDNAKEDYSIILPNHSISNFNLNFIKNVQYLALDYNSLGSSLDFSPLKGISFLNLSSNNLDNSSTLATVSQSIEYLILANNHFSSLVPISRFYKLRYLDLSANNLTDSNFEIKSEYLTDLILHNNNLHQLPNLNQVVNIKRLDLSHNFLDSFSAPHLQELQQLMLHNNKLKEIPNLKENKKLFSIGLSGNKIEQLDSRRLKEYYPRAYIDIRGNLISDLSIFEDAFFSHFDFKLTLNPIDRTSIYSCPQNSPNKSIATFCSSN